MCVYVCVPHAIIDLTTALSHWHDSPCNINLWDKHFSPASFTNRLKMRRIGVNFEKNCLQISHHISKAEWLLGNRALWTRVCLCNLRDNSVAISSFLIATKCLRICEWVQRQKILDLCVADLWAKTISCEFDESKDPYPFPIAYIPIARPCVQECQYFEILSTPIVLADQEDIKSKLTPWLFSSEVFNCLNGMHSSRLRVWYDLNLWG